MDPTLYFFNPTAEMAVANGIYSYKPPELLQRFEKEMAAIMLYFAGPQDVIIVDNYPDQGFLDQIKTIKPGLPRFLTIEEIANSDETYKNLVPWGWSPVVYKTLESILPKLGDEFSKGMWASWEEKYKAIYSRETAQKVLEAICKYEHPLIAPYRTLKAQFVSDISDIESALSLWGQVVLKAPFSSSGRGIQMLRKTQLNKSILAWINSIVSKQKGLMLEPLLQKIADLSFHFYFDGQSEPIYLGTVFFDTNKNGQFKGCYLRQHPDTSVNDFIQDYIDQEGIQIILKEMKQSFGSFKGYMGIDAMLIKNNNEMKLHPCVEINPRMTMGLLNLQLRNLIVRDGYWEMVYNKKGFDTIHMSSNKVPLCPVNSYTRFCAFLHLV